MSFARYAKYRPSGVEWLGDVPEHWTISPLKSLFDVVGGSTPDSGDLALWDGDILWATPADFGKSASMNLDRTQRLITSAGLASCGTTLVPPGSIVLST